MARPLAMFTDTSLCIGCRACQVACKQWNELPMEAPEWTGSYQNQSHFTDKTYRLVRFFEETDAKGQMKQWHMMSDVCKHCADAGCLNACPTGAISFGSKEDMTDLAEERVVDLVERGYKTAGLYDPQGVGGTHVMYVLKHADQPMLYAGLPADPSVAFSVELWKGGLKPLALLGMGAAMLGGLLHYLKVGPNDADAEEKEKEAS